MKVYLVRIATDHQVVGLFVAKNLYGLAREVDAVVSPHECEFAELKKPGGIYVSEATSAQFPMRMLPNNEDAHPDDRNPFNGASLSEDWWASEEFDHDWQSLGMPK